MRVLLQVHPFRPCRVSFVHGIESRFERGTATPLDGFYDYLLSVIWLTLLYSALSKYFTPWDQGERRDRLNQ